jgi:F-type H+-transporting ATPase subunit delta
MRNPILVNRYTGGLAGALRTESEYAAVRRDLEEFSGLVREGSDLAAALCRPFLPLARRVEIAEDIFGRLTLQEKSRRFLRLLMQHGRLEILPDVVRSLPAVWDAKIGVVPFEVRSVTALSAAQKARLEASLRSLEKRPVACSYVLDPTIIAGLAVRKGNMIYDVSLRGQLERLKNEIREG